MQEQKVVVDSSCASRLDLCELLNQNSSLKNPLPLILNPSHPHPDIKYPHYVVYYNILFWKYSMLAGGGGEKSKGDYAFCLMHCYDCFSSFQLFWTSFDGRVGNDRVW